MSTTHDVTDFRSEVLDRSRTAPVLVDFWAPWCGPCRTLGPTLERLANQSGDRWTLVKVNTEEYPELASSFGVMSIPNVKLFRDGEVIDEFVGALPESEIRRWLDLRLPASESPRVAAARALAEAGDVDGAIAALERETVAAPHDAATRLALAELLLRRAPERVHATLAPLGDEHADKVEALRVLAGWLLRAGMLPEGEAREPFAAALAAIRAGDWDAALAADVEALRRQRRWADGAARELGRALFIHLGVVHPVCEKHYRAFASALHV